MGYNSQSLGGLIGGTVIPKNQACDEQAVLASVLPDGLPQLSCAFLSPQTWSTRSLENVICKGEMFSLKGLLIFHPVFKQTSQYWVSLVKNLDTVPIVHTGSLFQNIVGFSHVIFV